MSANDQRANILAGRVRDLQARVAELTRDAEAQREIARIEAATEVAWAYTNRQGTPPHDADLDAKFAHLRAVVPWGDEVPGGDAA